MDPRQLLAHPLNFRAHGLEQERAVRTILTKIGWIDSVIVSLHSGRILNGHLRVRQAVQFGEATVPVRLVEVDEATEKLILATFDRIGALAGIDAAKQARLREQVAHIEDDAFHRLLAQQAKDTAASQLVKPKKEKTAKKAGVTVKVGPYSALIPQDIFDAWRVDLEQDADSKDLDMLASFVRKKLGLENPP